MSTDGVRWRELGTGATAGQVTSIDRPAYARSVRVTTTAASGNWWSLADVRLYR